MKLSKLFFIFLPLIYTHPALSDENIIVDKKRSPDVFVKIDDQSKKEIVSINSADNNNNISLNYYEKFNVPTKGIILNNKDARAKIIINEVSGEEVSSNKVTSDLITFIKGPISVIGKKAHVIVANPNGVECWGCSASNSAKLTLISGKINKENKTQFILSDKNYVSINNIGNLSSRKLNIISNEVFIDGTLAKNIATLNIFTGMSHYNILGKNSFDKRGRISFFEDFTHNLEKVNIYKNEDIYNNIYLDENIKNLKEKILINNKPDLKLDLYLY